MNNNPDSKKRSKKPIILTELMILLNKCKESYEQERVFHRAMALVMGELFAFGRHTIPQLLLTLGLVDEDWSAWYRIFSRNRFDEEKTAGVMLAEMLTEVAKTEPFVVSYPPL